MKKTQFFDLVRESVISQALLTTIIGVGVIVCYIVRGEVPEFLVYSFVAVVGFFFGSGAKHAAGEVNKAVREVIEAAPPAAKERIARIAKGERATDSFKAFVKEAERGDE